MDIITVTRLADLRVGDRLVSIGDITYRTRPAVTAELGPIEPGSPVRGVRLGTVAGGIENVRYPSQCDGQTIRVERP